METKRQTNTRENKHEMDRTRYHAVMDAIAELGKDYTYEQYRDFMRKRGFILGGGNV